MLWMYIAWERTCPAFAKAQVAKPASRTIIAWQARSHAFLSVVSWRFQQHLPELLQRQWPAVQVPLVQVTAQPLKKL